MFITFKLIILACTIMAKCDQDANKSVSFYDPLVKTPLAGIGHAKQDLIFLKEGSKLFKVKSRKKYLRKFFYDEDLHSIIWDSTHKSVSKSRIYINSIHEIRSGKSTESFRSSKAGSEFSDTQCFSIIHGHNFDVLDLASKEIGTVNAWISVLQSLIGGYTSENQPIRDRWLKDQFDQADKDSSETLEEKECSELFHALNLNISKKQVSSHFKQFDVNNNGKLDFIEFKQFFESLSTREEIVKIFNEYSYSSNVWDSDDFLIFLKGSQKCIDANEENVKDIIAKYEPTDVKTKNLLTIDGLTNFLLDPKHFIFDFKNKDVQDDMSHPLSHYFIASSHNTYLLEDQIRGPSSIEGYIRALRSGCRCVEIDVWNGPQGSPVVYHGHTLTSKILLENVLKAINEHAFISSPYPVIISIENHCSIEQQTTMAQLFHSIFDEKLFLEPIDVSRDALPSPSSFLNKILIKGKKLMDESEIGDVSDEDEASELETPEDLAKDSLLDSKKTQTPSTKKHDSENPHHKIKLSIQLSRCVNYIQASPFKGFDKCLNLESKYYAMSSFSEPKTESFMNKESWKLIEYNKRQISRIYPKGSRIDSSNYYPVTMWSHGCQIVALNYQTNGEIMDINNGFFAQNGKCGYLLKPSCLRETLLAYEPSNTIEKGAPGILSKYISILVISGQQLPKPSGSNRRGEVIDPYVNLTIYGPGMDNQCFKTKVISDNGFNPNWNETFNFEVKFPELSFLRFVVYDYDRLSEDDFIGQYTIPLNSVMRGYRHIPLLSKEGNVIEFASLFVHIFIEDLVLFKNKGTNYINPQIDKISKDLPDDVSNFLKEIQIPVTKSSILYDEYYTSISDIKKALELNIESSSFHFLRSIYMRDPELRLSLVKCEKRYELFANESEKQNRSIYFGLLKIFVDQCERVIELYSHFRETLFENTETCKLLLKKNYGDLVVKRGTHSKLIDLAYVVGELWIQIHKLDGIYEDANLSIELIKLFISRQTRGSQSSGIDELFQEHNSKLVLNDYPEAVIDIVDSKEKTISEMEQNALC